MRVIVNGEQREIASSRVDALLSELEYEGTHFAIALNYDVLPKSRWAETHAEGRRRDRDHHAAAGRVRMRSRSHSAVIARLDRAIQYAAAFCDSHLAAPLEYWIPAFAGMTAVRGMTMGTERPC